METLAKEILIRTFITLAVFFIIMLILGAYKGGSSCGCKGGEKKGCGCGGGNAPGTQEPALGLTTSTSL